uniref:ATP-binding cassette transporter subfamily C member 4 X1 protein n=1 Tax=Brachionus koreanus TaxID=1199090 RepID=A0A1J0MMT2_9BILA|nr:ATP-binding cassette transporter subfamily C member 4 X1 protein [Brachionus koreanus]
MNSPVDDDQADKLIQELEKEWINEQKKFSKPSLARALIRWYKRRAILNALLVLIQETINIFQPLFISIILQYFNGTIELSTALIFAGLSSICVLIDSMLHHPYFLNAYRYGMRLRIACWGLIYRKILRLSLKTLDSKSAGDIINLLSTDATRIEFGMYFLPYLVTGPIQMVVVITIIYTKVGLSFLSGLLLLSLIVPAKWLILKQYNKFRTRNCRKSDERITVLTEILNSIKIIKMYCWEIPFTKRVTDLRNEELRYQTFLNLVQSLTATIDTIMATLMSFLNISFFIAFAGIPLVPSFIVFSIGFYMRLCNSVGFNFSRAIVSVVNFRVSAKRVGDFLLMKELDMRQVPEPSDQELAIKIDNLNFSWKQDEFSLKNINIEVKKGDFVSIVGPVGSGKKLIEFTFKSSLLLGMVGELENYTGQIFKKGKIFYLTQQPWVFTASIRQNITFGLPYIKEKFDKIVDVCSLKKDLELLTYGEETLVGEKGINLSGGQRARICLARALYSEADIYLFDDTLSAVDGTVAKHIMKNCINGYLENKTRILITHQVHHLETADKIYVIRDGKIEAEGKYDDLLKSHLAALSSMEDAESGGDFDAIEETTDEKAELKKREVNTFIDDLKEKQNTERNCINDYLREKTRILVSHQVHLLESSNKILVLNNGFIEAQGSYSDLLKSHLEKLSSIDKTETSQDDTSITEAIDDVPEEEANDKQILDSKAKQEFNKKEREEIQQQGAVTWKSYAAYFTAGAGYFGLLGVVFLFIAAQSMTIAADYWLSIWSNREEEFEIKQKEIKTCLENLDTQNLNCTNVLMNYDTNTDPSSVSLIYDDRERSYKIYLTLVCIAFFVVALRSVAFFMLCVKNSKNTYQKLFASVRDTAIRFFDLNPIGRILNRFSKDTNNMDEMLTLYLYEFCQVAMVILGALVVPISVNPWLILPLIPLGYAFLVIKNYFISTARDLKRLDSIGRSPLFVYTNTTIEGISTIRVANKEGILAEEFNQLTDYHTRACFNFFVVNRWFGLRLDILCSLYTITTLFGSLFLKDYLGLKPGQVGLLMVYLFQLFHLFQWSIALWTNVENLMTSIERIVEYTNIPSEPLNDGKIEPPINWPTSGEIKFDKVSLNYDKNLPSVLKEISLNIKAGEKIGIVGRTGAGKSSFFQAIFRMYEPSGKIFIDGVDITQLSLNNLRTKLTIIPQEPVLFSGTLRLNLDPFNKYSDQEIWSAVESVSLKNSVQSMNAGLDTLITTGGTNLSVGQKQLICLARAILKKTKILIIDEATANVDYNTDAIIQKTIREQFKDCTVLTIAHRLATVVDSDRILCLSEGKIVNFGVPKDLLNDQTSILYELTKKLSANEKKLIFDIANGVKKIDLAKDYVPIEQDYSIIETKSVKSLAYENKAADFSDDEMNFYKLSILKL